MIEFRRKKIHENPRRYIFGKSKQKLHFHFFCLSFLFLPHLTFRTTTISTLLHHLRPPSLFSLIGQQPLTTYCPSQPNLFSLFCLDLLQALPPSAISLVVGHHMQHHHHVAAITSLFLVILHVGSKAQLTL